MSRRIQVLTFCLVLLATLGSLRFADAGELVVVWLDDGRMLAGEVDSRTSDERLWLRSAAPSFIIATSAAWDHIKAVNVNGQRLAVDVFSERIDQFRPKQGDLNRLPPPGAEVHANVTTALTRPVARPNAATRVVSLDVEARVANWDQDAATDGVELRVLPRNTFGEIIPVLGQITATLLARGRRPANDAEAFPQLGRWSLQADTNEFSPYGAIYRLPFRGQHPDEELSLEPHGLVEVTLFVSGQGRFTSDAVIYLRRFNPVRRDMQRRAADRDR